MGSFLSDLNTFQSVFFVISASSTIILIIQTILALVGLSHNNDAETGESYISDGGTDVEADIGGSGIDIADSAGEAADISADHDFSGETNTEHAHDQIDPTGLRLFTVRSIMAFLMMGSWVGFLLSRAGANEFVSLLGAAVSGIVALVFMAKLMQLILGLQEDGTTKIKNALGQTGQVYIRIPGGEKGKGKVNVTVQEKLCEFDAVTKQSETIKTGEMIYVTDVREGNVLVVEKAGDK